MHAFNFKVGNPLLDWRMNFKGQVDYYWSHGLMSDEVFANITRHCDDDSDSDVGACDGAVQAVDAGQLDYYNIYAPVCVDAANGGSYYPTSAQLPDPCSYHYTYSYLNDPAVQDALHARPTTWSGCAYVRSISSGSGSSSGPSFHLKLVRACLLAET